MDNKTNPTVCGKAGSKRAIKRYQNALADPPRLVLPGGLLGEELAAELKREREKREKAPQEAGKRNSDTP